MGCLLEHNCVPNAHRSFGADASICVRAAVPIEAGEHISITYTDSLWPTAERRSHLVGCQSINNGFSTPLKLNQLYFYLFLLLFYFLLLSLIVCKK